MIEIIIADDHSILRAGLKTILSGTADMSIVDEASTAEELMNKLMKRSFDLVILDLSMPGRGGLDALFDIRKQYPKMPVLVLSVYPEEQIAERVIQSGAAGYINKETAPDVIIEAIRLVSSGRKYISDMLAEKLASKLETGRSGKPHELLSAREYQVLCLIGNGKSLTTIAEDMSLSVKTIATYRSRILEKMSLKNNSELTYYVVKNNLNNLI